MILIRLKISLKDTDEEVVPIDHSKNVDQIASTAGNVKLSYGKRSLVTDHMMA